MSANRKIVYFLSHPIQYFSPMLKALAEVTDLDVYYYSDASIKGAIDKGFGRSVTWDTPLLDGYRSAFLKNHRGDHGMNNKFWDVWNPGVWKTVRASGAEVIILNGWTYSSSWLVLVAAKVFGKEVWLRAENPLNQELRKSRGLIWIKTILLKYFLFRWFVDKCLYIGTESKSFFSYYGVPGGRMVYTPYAVDNAYFRSAWNANKDRLPQIKASLGLPAGKKILLFAGKYIPKKRPLDLLEVVASLDRENYFLVMVGEGELRPQMERFIRENNMDNVLLTGFINQTEMPLYYSVADVFVMCSGMGETWGLSVNEAMNFSKPVIVSDTCGCSTDLVRHGINGFVFPEGDLPGLKGSLLKMMESDEDRARMGEASREMIDAFSIGAIVENIQRAIYAG
ncbi:MAG TPA: glycosyltransferase family 4 protein [Puia sp.]|nr:glycosyltransferase family 4 protein [Puia sp.]